MSKSELVTQDQTIHPVAVQQERHMKLMELALQNKADIASIEKLVQLQNDFEAKEARKAFFAALSRFQSQLPVIEKKGLASFEHRNGGGQTSYSYAKLEDIAKAVKPLLVENGLSYRYEQRHDQQMITVVCIVTHEDGHEERTEMSGFADQSGKKNPIQQIASTVSYLRRYTMTGALGITVSDEDNDAADYQAAPMQQQPEFYPDDQFNKSFPQWEQQILSGQKTADQILGFLAKKGVNLSQHQVSIVQQVGRA
ncbi:hypothetical protein [Vibrio phage vB_ValP_FGH]|nr:hypothetical protein [Vibrio phage vB_ValP_FGH]